MTEIKEYIVRCHSRFDSERPAVHCQFPIKASSLAEVESETKRVMKTTHGVDPLNIVIDSIIEYSPIESFAIGKPRGASYAAWRNRS
jgi:predicted small metal-binding protein